MTELHTELHDEEELSTADMAAAASPAASMPKEEGGVAEPKGRPVAIPMGDGSTTAPPQDRAAAPPGGAGTAPGDRPQAAVSDTAPLFPEQEAQEMRSRWDDIQAGFVDNPRQAVEQADHLVAQAMKRLADMFAGERNQLEQQWSRGDDVDTEDLRVALQRYRSFFGRLLSF
jgi:hypothetical protein